MFCYRCGIQIGSEADFCHKCGTKIPKGSNSEENLKSENQSTFIKQSERVMQSSSIRSNTIDNFENYVESYIRNTTKFCSVQELLNSHVSSKFIWICFGIPSLFIFRVNHFPEELFAVLGIVLLFGYPAALLTDHIKSSTFMWKNYKAKEINVEIDTDDLINFLNEYLKYLHPYFHKWGYISYKGYGLNIEKMILASTVTSLQNKIDSQFGAKIGTEFGRKKRCFVFIRVSRLDPDTKKATYWFETAMRTSMISKYVCAVKTAPILQATMKYYLEEYRKIE